MITSAWPRRGRAFLVWRRAAKLKFSVREYLSLLEAIKAGVIDDPEGGSPTATASTTSRAPRSSRKRRSTKVRRAFAAYFKGVELLTDFTQDIPLEWLQQRLELTPEEKAKIEKMGWDELMETLKKRFEEEKKRHEGGNKVIGTGTSPFVAYGYNSQGPRIGQDKGPHPQRGEGLGPASVGVGSRSLPAPARQRRALN